MRGHDLLIKLRLKGFRPALVELTVDRPMPAWYWREWHTEVPHVPVQARILIDQNDSPELLDLRFVVGMSVKVEGDNPARVARAYDAALKAGAKRVISACRGEFRDSEGQLQ
jgi:hypothetical protein